MLKELSHPEYLALAGAHVAPQQYHGSPVRLIVESGFRQRWLFLICLALIVGAAAAVTLAKSTQYQSEMKFLVQASRTNAVISADRSVVAPAQDVTEEQINSEMELLQSHDVLGAVVDPDWHGASQAGKTQAQIEQHESKIAGFKKHLTVEAGHKANVITVTVRSDTPEHAAHLLDLLSTAYLARRREITRPPGTSAFFAEETKRYKDAWARADQDMVAFQQQHGLVSVPDMEEALNQQLLTRENEFRTAQAALAATNERVEEANRVTSSIPARQPTQQRLTPNQGAVQQVESVLLRLQNRRTELLNRFQPTDLLVKEIDQQIADTSATLARIRSAPEKESTTDVDPAWQRLRTDGFEAKVEKRATESKLASLQGEIARLHQQLASIQPLSIRYDQLQEQLDQARSNFELFSQKRDQSRIEDAMDERKLVNIAVAESPTINFHPVAPRPLLYMGLGFITALFLASSAAYFAESWRTTIATPRELALYSRYPVLAALPYDAATAQLNIRPRAGASRQQTESPFYGVVAGLLPAMQAMNSMFRRSWNR